jgi:hypothetical protein
VLLELQWESSRELRFENGKEAWRNQPVGVRTVRAPCSHSALFIGNRSG